MVVVIESRFHGTEAVLRPKNGRVSARSMKRARDICCGMRDCRCPITVARVNGEDTKCHVFEPNADGSEWELIEVNP